MHPQSPALRALAEKWDAVPAAERANFQSYATELCEALGVERPRPRGSGYEFEHPVTTTDRKTGRDTTNFIDLYRQGHFILEGKHIDAASMGEDRAMGRAYGQAKVAERQPWPAGAIEQIAAAKAHVAAAPATPAEVAAAFAGAPVALVARHLETLAMVGEVRQLADGRYEAVVEPL